jgi:hypothetical protein
MVCAILIPKHAENAKLVELVELERFIKIVSEIVENTSLNLGIFLERAFVNG